VRDIGDETRGPTAPAGGLGLKGMSQKSFERRVTKEVIFFFFTLVTGPRRSLSLKLSDTRVYEPQIRARLGTTAHFCRLQGGHSSPQTIRRPHPPSSERSNIVCFWRIRSEELLAQTIKSRPPIMITRSTRSMIVWFWRLFTENGLSPSDKTSSFRRAGPPRRSKLPPNDPSMPPALNIVWLWRIRPEELLAHTIKSRVLGWRGLSGTPQVVNLTSPQVF